MKDYYKILGVSIDSTDEDIKKSFRLKALKIHPDKSGKDTQEEFIELFEAYSILINKIKRDRYNLIYEWINTAPKEPDNELEKEILAIQSQGKSYSQDFKIFDKEVLSKILLDLLLVLDKLVFASTIAVLLGLTTIIKGIGNFDFEYSLVGLALTCVGLFFGKLKIDNVRYFEHRYSSQQKK